MLSILNADAITATACKTSQQAKHVWSKNVPFYKLTFHSLVSVGRSFVQQLRNGLIFFFFNWNDWSEENAIKNIAPMAWGYIIIHDQTNFHSNQE